MQKMTNTVLNKMVCYQERDTSLEGIGQGHVCRLTHCIWQICINVPWSMWMYNMSVNVQHIRRLGHKGIYFAASAAYSACGEVGQTAYKWQLSDS